MTLKIKKVCITGFLSIFFLNIPVILFAQDNMTSYFMYGMPQSNFLNPATQPECNVYIGIPGISQLSLDFSNNALSFNDVIFYDAEIDSFITPLHPRGDEEEFLKRFKKINYIRNNFFTKILDFGFRSKEMYFSFHYGIKSETNINYSKDLMQFLIKANEGADIIDLSGFGGRVRLYDEIALGISINMDSQLTLGGRLKLLSGKAEFEVKNQDIYAEPGSGGWTEAWILNSTFDIKGSIPFIELYKTGEEIDSFELDTDREFSEYNSLLSGRKNLGFGLDFGAHYKAIDNLTISASIVDLGFIRWSNNSLVVSQDSQYEFRGIEFSIDDSDTSGFFSGVLDSIKESFEFIDKSEPYSSFLTSKIYLGARYYLSDKVNFGLLSKTEIYRGKFYPQITLSANVFPIKVFSASLTYSILNREFYNIGLGLGFKGGPINLFIISDTYPLVFTKGTPIPVHLKGFRFQFGFSILIGNNKEKKLMQDEPLID